MSKEEMSEIPTPDTDAQASPHIGFYSCATVPADFARKLERERDEAIRERDEAREELNEIKAERDLARLSSMESDQTHDRMVGELESVYKQLDEARERLEKITSAAQGVVDRWEQPAWKDTEPTAVVIYRLRDALGGESQ